MTPFQVQTPASSGEILLWSHAVLIWVLVNYVHRLDPLGRAEARSLDDAAIRRWRWVLVARAATGAVVVTALAGVHGASFGLGGLLLAGSVVLALVRLRWMRAEATAGRDFRAEWELAVNVVFLAGSALLVGAGRVGLEIAMLELPAPSGWIVGTLLVTAGALFLLRGGTHVVRGILEKTDTLPEELASLGNEGLRHGVTIGNIERLLIYLFALAGSPAAIGLVLAAKGVVRAVEWRDRALVEYFLIGTLASAGLAAAVGVGVRWSLEALQ